MKYVDHNTAHENYRIDLAKVKFKPSQDKHIKKYTSFGPGQSNLPDGKTYHRINQALRNNKPLSRQDRKTVKTIDLCLAQSINSSQEYVYHGKEHLGELVGLNIGDVFSFTAFTSTSYQLGTASSYASSPDYVGLNILNARGIPVNFAETELLLPRNSQFKIIDYFKSSWYPNNSWMTNIYTVEMLR